MGIDVYKQIMYWKENVRLNQNTMRICLQDNTMQQRVYCLSTSKGSMVYDREKSNRL